MKKTAYLISKAFFWGFALFATFILVFSLLSFLEYYLNWNIPFVEFSEINKQDYASIKIPFIELTVKFLFSYTIIFMWLTFVFYSVYFYVLQSFFEIFISEKTFQNQSLRKLNTFYKINFIPVIVGFIGIIIEYFISKNFRFDEPHFFVLIHLIIVFVLYFYLDLIKKGTAIQQENDLTI